MRDKIVDRVADLATRLVGTQPGSELRSKILGNMVVSCWNAMEPHQRRDMRNRMEIMDDGTIMTGPWPIETIAWRWGCVVRYGFTGWDGEFVRSIDVQRKRPGFKPSASQEENMRRLYAEAMRNTGKQAEEVKVVE